MLDRRTNSSSAKDRLNWHVITLQFNLLTTQLVQHSSADVRVLDKGLERE